MVVTFLNDDDEKYLDQQYEQTRKSYIQMMVRNKVHPKQEELKKKFRELDWKAREYFQMQSMKVFPEYYEVIKDDFEEYLKRLRYELKLAIDTFKMQELDKFQEFIDDTWDDETRDYDNVDGNGGKRSFPPPPPVILIKSKTRKFKSRS